MLQLLQAVRDLIARLLTTDPTRRYNVPDVRAHPWSGPELEIAGNGTGRVNRSIEINLCSGPPNAVLSIVWFCCFGPEGSESRIDHHSKRLKFWDPPTFFGVPQVKIIPGPPIQPAEFFVISREVLKVLKQFGEKFARTHRHAHNLR